MKTKTFLTVTTLFLIISALGQKPTMELTFTAENNSQYVPLDSIFIENLTQGEDTTLYAPDTVLVLDYNTGIGDNEAIEENTFSVSQNYPNPFKGKTEFNLYLLKKEYIIITVQDILGRELAFHENKLKQGKHSFTFYPGIENYYLLTVTGKKTSKTIKMLNTNSNTTYEGKCKIVYNKYENNLIGFKSQKAINDFVFNIGDELQFTAYSHILERSIIDSPTGNQTYTFQYSTGIPCPGTPTVTDIDGNVYNTVLIGSQCWMQENLKTTTYKNGTSIPNVADRDIWINPSTGAYVWFGNDISWMDLYGALYNWRAVIDSNGLCPDGWHIPSNEEWTELTDFIGGADAPHGIELKTCRQINSPLGGECNTSNHPRWLHSTSSYGTDNYGFSGLPGGYRSWAGTFYYLGFYGSWWSSTEYESGSAWARGLFCNHGYFGVDSKYKRSGFSVRCLQD